MSEHIYQCVKCSAFTMKAVHCDEKTFSHKPPKYKPDFKYGEYRRKVKNEQYKEAGLI